MYKIIEKIIIFVFILTSGAPYFRDYTDQMIIISLMLLLIIQFSKNIKLTIPKYLLLVIFLLSFQVVLKNIEIKTTIGIVIKIYLVFLYGVVFNREKFWIILSRQVYYLAIISLITYTIYFIFNDIPLLNLIKTDMDGGRNVNYYIAIFEKSYFGNIPRNQSIFWEPGAYQFFLNVALMINIYIKKIFWNSKENVILIISLISTFSTTGYIVLGIILFSDLIISNRNMSLKLKLLYTIVGSILVVALFSSDIVIQKLSDNENQSLFRRTADTITDLNLFFENFVWGYGIDNRHLWQNYMYTNYGLYSENIDSSNSLFSTFAQFGILFSVYYFSPLLTGLSLTKNRIIFISLIFLFLLTENFRFSPLLISLLILRPKQINNKA